VRALDHVPQLGARLTDDRWYLVRNLVTILASTRSPIVLPFMERTLRHGDARVRRETIRGLSTIHSATAASLLVAALNDAEASNVQVTARYLGLVGAVSAAPALERVALGNGPGNRDTAVRVEAIHALAKFGSPSSIAVMRALSSRRGLFGSGPSREVREAALGALRTLSAAQTSAAVDS
jgi:HEAT repeat protein